MNRECDILEQAIKALPASAGVQISPDRQELRAKGHNRADGTVAVCVKGFKFQTYFEVKKHLHPATISQLTEGKRGQERRLLLVTPLVTQRYADMLAAAGIDFIDTAGNMLFQRDNLFVLITGRKPAAGGGRVDSSGSGRAFEANGLKLIFTLLTDPQLNAKETTRYLTNQPYRKISSMTGISLGSVGWIMADLVAQGYILSAEKGVRVLVERRRLFTRWTEGFTTKLRRKLVIARYHSTRPRWWENADVRKTNGLWGGEVGGAKLTDYLSPGTVTIYTKALSSDFIVEHDLRLDPAGSVTVMKPFWGELPRTSKGDCVHPLLVYADLTASEIDRNLETARRIYDRYLRPTIEAA